MAAGMNFEAPFKGELAFISHLYFLLSKKPKARF